MYSLYSGMKLESGKSPLKTISHIMQINMLFTSIFLLLRFLHQVPKSESVMLGI